jgi:hypothetical protein
MLDKLAGRLREEVGLLVLDIVQCPRALLA